MTVIIDPYTLPEKGKVNLNLQRSFEIRVTAEEARFQIRHWLSDEINLVIEVDSPTLVLGEQVVWRMPIWISVPHTGRAGLVDTIDVDVTTGAMDNTAERKAQIKQRAEEVAARQPPYRLGEVSEQYLAKNIPSSPELHMLENVTKVTSQVKDDSSPTPLVEQVARLIRTFNYQEIVQLFELVPELQAVQSRNDRKEVEQVELIAYFDRQLESLQTYPPLQDEALFLAGLTVAEFFALPASEQERLWTEAHHEATREVDYREQQVRPDALPAR